MKTTIITKEGRQTIDTENFVPYMASSSSIIFKAVEHVFFEWFEHHGSNNKDLIGCYEGWAEDEPATHVKSGAIREGINNLIEYLEEKKLKFITTKDFWKVPITDAFEV